MRLLVQQLQRMGYTQAAERLERESGIPMESAEVARFRQCILDGSWSDAMPLLSALLPNDPSLYARAAFCIYEQKFLELLELDRVREALQCLRHDLAPLKQDTARLHELTRQVGCIDSAACVPSGHRRTHASRTRSLIMCPTAEEMRNKVGRAIFGRSARANLLVRLQEFIPANALLADGRLEQLVAQAMERQRQCCLYHDASDRAFSLLRDHSCTVYVCRAAAVAPALLCVCARVD